MSSVVGIICEYNPLHSGHAYHIAESRRLIAAADALIMCVMSGTVTQRGEFAIVDKYSRAMAAVKAGADIVLELPSEFACASADIFAAKALQILNATGVVTHLSFGCQEGSLDGLCALADLPSLYTNMDGKMPHIQSYAAEFQQYAAEKLPEHAHLLQDANNLLAICYLRALPASIKPIAVTRQGVSHDGGISGGYASASAVRELWRSGESEPYSTPEMAAAFAEKEARGLAPVMIENNMRGILTVLRSLSAEQWRTLPDVNQGLEHCFMRAAAESLTLDELLLAVKSKRYTLARLRRIAMCAYLGIIKERQQASPEYLRVLALSQAGRGGVKQMHLTAKLPIVTKPANHKELLAFESSVTDLAALCRPKIGVVGDEWRRSPYVLT